MTNEEVMNLMTDIGLHEGGMENWIPDNAWVRVVNKVIEIEREKSDRRMVRQRNNFGKVLVKAVVDEREACAKKWVGLSDDEREHFRKLGFVGVLAVENKLKEKNSD